MSRSRITNRMAGVLAGAALTVIGVTGAAAPSFASSPVGDYTASLSPYVSSVAGTAKLDHALNGWSASVQLTGLTAGDSYTYEVSIASNYIDGQAHSFDAIPLCTFVANGPSGHCNAYGALVPGTTLSPQSSAFVYSPAAHGEVATGEFSYWADLAAYEGLSGGGHASLQYGRAGTWGGERFHNRTHSRPDLHLRSGRGRGLQQRSTRQLPSDRPLLDHSDDYGQHRL